MYRPFFTELRSLNSWEKKTDVKKKYISSNTHPHDLHHHNSPSNGKRSCWRSPSWASAVALPMVWAKRGWASSTRLSTSLNENSCRL